VKGAEQTRNAERGTRNKTSPTSPGARTQLVRRTSSGLRPPSPQSGEGQHVTHCATVPEGEQLFTKPEIAKLLKVSIRTITEMMRRGEIAYLKINGRLVRFRLDDVHARLTETCLVCNAAEGRAEILKAETLKCTSPQPSPQRGEGERRKGVLR